MNPVCTAGWQQCEVLPWNINKTVDNQERGTDVTWPRPGPACIITISGDVTQSRPRPRLPIMCPAGYIGECVGNIESRWRNKQRIERQ